MWQEEFPEHYRVPNEVMNLVISGDIEDMSWRHDPCPSFGKRLPGGTWVRLFVEHPDPAERRLWECRFTVMVQPDPSVMFGLRVGCTDDTILALAHLKRVVFDRRRGWRFKIRAVRPVFEEAHA